MSRSCIAQGDAMPPEWINLYLAPAKLNLMDDGRLRGAFGNVEAAIASAVQSGGVPTRGMASAAFAFERIDGRMTHARSSTYRYRMSRSTEKHSSEFRSILAR
jgi:citrate synthase